MNEIVSNTGPLIALAGIGRLELLRELFGSVLVAREVQEEVEAGGRQGIGAKLFQTAPWLHVVSPSRAIDSLLAAKLDLGEAATITLALEKAASLVLLDEAKARRIAHRVYGLPVLGTGRLLVEAKRASLIPLVRPLIDQLRSNGYWISEKIIAAVLGQAGE